MRKLLSDLCVKRYINEEAYISILNELDHIEHQLKIEKIKAQEDEDYGREQGLKLALKILRGQK